MHVYAVAHGVTRTRVLSPKSGGEAQANSPEVIALHRGAHPQEVAQAVSGYRQMPPAYVTGHVFSQTADSTAR